MRMHAIAFQAIPVHCPQLQRKEQGAVEGEARDGVCLAPVRRGREQQNQMSCDAVPKGSVWVSCLPHITDSANKWNTLV